MREPFLSAENPPERPPPADRGGPRTGRRTTSAWWKPERIQGEARRATGEVRSSLPRKAGPGSSAEAGSGGRGCRTGQAGLKSRRYSQNSRKWRSDSRRTESRALRYRQRQCGRQGRPRTYGQKRPYRRTGSGEPPRAGSAEKRTGESPPTVRGTSVSVRRLAAGRVRLRRRSCLRGNFWSKRQAKSTARIHRASADCPGFSAWRAWRV